MAKANLGGQVEFFTSGSAYVARILTQPHNVELLVRITPSVPSHISGPQSQRKAIVRNPDAARRDPPRWLYRSRLPVQHASNVLIKVIRERVVIGDVLLLHRHHHIDHPKLSTVVMLRVRERCANLLLRKRSRELLGME